MHWRQRLRGFYQAWLRRRIPPARQVVLNQRRIFIFPTGYGFFYLLVAGALFIGGINYENNPMMGLAFLMASLFVTAILHTYRNLSGLMLRAGGYEQGFAGGKGRLEVVLGAADHHWHRGLWLRWPGGSPREVSVEPRSEESRWLEIPLPRRGRVKAERLRVHTRYPLGLLRAWSLVDLDHLCLAWPKPLPGGDCPATGGREQQGQRITESGGEDFQGLRGYVTGDSLRLVDWKAYARGRGMNTKRFADPVEGRRWLDWDRLPGLDAESRLSRLAWWVLELDRGQAPYGLLLDGRVMDPGSGPEHRRKLLDALALYGEGRRG